MTTINDLTNVDPNNPHHYAPQLEGETYLQYMLRMGIDPAKAGAYLYSASYDSYQPWYTPDITHAERLNRTVNPWLYMTEAERNAKIQSDQEGIIGWANHWADKTNNPAIGAQYANDNINEYNKNYMNPYAVSQKQPVDLYNNDWQKSPSAPAYTAQNFIQYATDPQAASNNPPAVTNNTNTNTNNTVPAATGNNAGIDPTTGMLTNYINPGNQTQGASSGGGNANNSTAAGGYTNPAAHVPGLNRTNWRRGTWNPVQARIG